MKESKIRPKLIFEEFLRLARKDINTFFSDAKREEILCPACSETGEYSFNKDGFDYPVCNYCPSLYVNPRPHIEAFMRYYIESESSKYWATTFYKETAEIRKKEIWNPKARLIQEILNNKQSSNHQIWDVGGGYGIFAEVMKQYSSSPINIIEPAPHLAEVCRKKGFNVVEKFLEDVLQADLKNNPKCFVCFELFEHLHDPKEFLLNLNRLMQPDDLFIFTTLSGVGLDIQVLWEKSPSVSPPHHLNFFNPRSIKIILERTEFKNIEVTTPGKLDIDILNNNKNSIKSKFWSTFLKIADEECCRQWQSMISNTGWSSHMMVVCNK